MPTYLLPLRWTPQGFDNLKSGLTQRTIRPAATAAAARNHVTLINIKDTLAGPDWTVSDDDPDGANVETLLGIFRRERNVTCDGKHLV